MTTATTPADPAVLHAERETLRRFAARLIGSHPAVDVDGVVDAVLTQAERELAAGTLLTPQLRPWLLRLARRQCVSTLRGLRLASAATA